MDVLVTYDIADTGAEGGRRLRRVAEVCERYGQRVQLSVFECRVSPTRLARLIGEIEDVIDVKADSVLVYRFPGRIQDAAQRLGRDSDHVLGQPWVI